MKKNFSAFFLVFFLFQGPLFASSEVDFRAGQNQQQQRAAAARIQLARLMAFDKLEQALHELSHRIAEMERTPRRPMVAEREMDRTPRMMPMGRMRIVIPLFFGRGWCGLVLSLVGNLMIVVTSQAI